MYGSKGQDYFNGGAKDDILEGGKGADVFKISTGTDTITDFSLQDGDRIAVPDEFINEFTVSGDVDNTVITVEGYGQLVLEGVKTKPIEDNIVDIFVRYI